VVRPIPFESPEERILADLPVGWAWYLTVVFLEIVTLDEVLLFTEGVDFEEPDKG